jgi:hypothetical protein
MTVFWVVAPCFLVEVYQRFRGRSCLHHQGSGLTLVNVFQTTWRYNTEDSHLRTHRRENLRSNICLSSPVCSSLQLPASFSLLGPNILFCALLSGTLNFLITIKTVQKLVIARTRSTDTTVLSCERMCYTRQQEDVRFEILTKFIRK